MIPMSRKTRTWGILSLSTFFAIPLLFSPTHIKDPIWVSSMVVFCLSWWLGQRYQLKSCARQVAKDQAQLTRIFDNTDIAIWSLDVKSQTVQMLNGIEKMLGYSSAECSRTNFWQEIILPADLPALQSTLANIGAGSDNIVQELRFQRKDGSVMWAQVRANIERDSGGRVIQVQGVLVD